jgi:hypothetical protein
MANGLHKFSVQEAQNAKLGQAGYKFLTSGNTGTAVAGVEYVAIVALSASQIDTTSFDSDTYPDLENVPLPVGTTIYGRWNKVTLDSGDIICYRG